MDNDELLKIARKRFDLASAALNETRQSELEDLKFFAGSPDNNWQWPQDVVSSRGAVNSQPARPTLTINKLPQHVRQITNDQRQNRPAGKVIPVDDKADIKVAEIFDGIVRHIEYASDADVAYDTACENQVTAGEGYFRLLTEYCDDLSHEQDIKIGRIRNPFSVYMDPNIQDPCGADAEWCWLTTDVPREEYEHNWPGAKPLSTLEANGIGDPKFGQWINDKSIRVGEYFYAEYVSGKSLLFPDGNTFLDNAPEVSQYASMGIFPVKDRPTKIRKIKWIKTNGYEVLEEGEWAGRWIPVIRVIGNEFEIEGELHLSGIVRNSKDAQRMYNYWASQEAEMLALAPKAPFIGYGGQFEGYEAQWKSANTMNWPYLEANPDVTDAQGTPLPLPQRAMPPMAPAGLIQAKMGAADDIKSTTGQYDSSLGAEANEKSGKAILAREKQADTGTYHYVDNLARAIRFSTRQIVDLIPKIYDTRRVARIIGLDGEADHVQIDPNLQQPMVEERDQNGAIIKRIYNPTIGKYDVRVTTGPGYLTKRQEIVQAMTELSQGVSDPTAAMVMRYFAMKNMDFPDVEKFAQVLKKMLPPGLLDDDENASPELMQAKKQMQQMQQTIEQMRGMLENVNQSMEAQENRIKAFDAETRRIAATRDSMTPEQIQEVVVKTLYGMMGSGDLVGDMQGSMMEVGA